MLYCLPVPAVCTFMYIYTNPIKGVLDEEVEAQRVKWISQGLSFPWGIPDAHSVIPSKQSDLSLWPLGLTVSIPGLERALQQYTLEPSEKPFDLKSVPLATAPMAEQRTGK